MASLYVSFAKSLIVGLYDGRRYAIVHLLALTQSLSTPQGSAEGETTHVIRRDITSSILVLVMANIPLPKEPGMVCEVDIAPPSTRAQNPEGEAPDRCREVCDSWQEVLMWT